MRLSGAVSRVIAVLAAMGTANAIAALGNIAEARAMSTYQLEQIFKQGTIEQGLPVGYGYGYAMVVGFRPFMQIGAAALWHGKKFEVTSGNNCPGQCGQRGVIHNVLTTGESWPAYAYIGHFSDVNPVLKGLQLDNKLSVIVDYGNGGGDEIRLVNSEKRLYLGRGNDHNNQDRLFAYFTLQFFDEPQDVNMSGHGDLVLIPSRGEGEGEGVPMGVAVPATTGEVEREDAPQQAQAGKLRGQRA
jgi:hypothetical protein